jgi:hypothetical protein
MSMVRRLKEVFGEVKATIPIVRISNGSLNCSGHRLQKYPLRTRYSSGSGVF